MNNKVIFWSFIAVLCTSCATGAVKVKERLTKREESFNYTDKNGAFHVKISSGMDKSEKIYFTKKSMEVPSGIKTKVLEKNIVLSDIGSVKKMAVLRPKKSQYTVWFDGKKYFSQLTMVPEKKSIEVKTQSPEAEWNGSKLIALPSTKTLPCFFSQVIECAEMSGFLDLATKKEDGVMNLLIVWEGYPFLNETFSDFPVELFSAAQLEYDGKTDSDERKFNLRVAGQSIVFVLNDDNKMVKMFWVTQGISMVGKSAQNKSSEMEDPGFE